MRDPDLKAALYDSGAFLAFRPEDRHDLIIEMASKFARQPEEETSGHHRRPGPKQ